MDIFQHNCEVTMKNTNQTHVGTWELLVKTVPPSSPPTRRYSFDVIVVGKFNFVASYFGLTQYLYLE